MKSLRNLTPVAALVLLGGCSWTGNLLKGDKVDYKSQGQVEAPSLEVPPDLTAPTRESRFTVPGDDNRRAAVTASELAQKGANARPANSRVLLGIFTNFGTINLSREMLVTNV